MPVTAILSRAFYDKLGDEIANELVNWLNQVDLTYRTELRELNDLNFARFDAKMGERLAQLRAELRAEIEKTLRSAEGTLRAEMDVRFARVDQRLETIADKIRDSKTSTLKWMFGFWVGTALVILGSRLTQ